MVPRWQLQAVPVQRVVALLGKMKAELEAEAKNEAEMYDKQVCWCETNEKEKTKAIADAEAKDIELGAEIESRGARFGELSAKIDIMKKQVAKDTEALATATSIREKEAAGFRQEEKDLVQYITNLKNAVQILSKHNFVQTGGKSSLLQVSSLDGEVVSSLRVLLRDVALKYEMLNAAKESTSAPRKVTALLSMAEGQAATTADSQALLSALDVHGASVSDAIPANLAARLVERAAQAPRKGSKSAFLQADQPAGAGESRASASNGIYGILNQMLEEFESNLSTAQREEATAATDFAAMSAAKEDQIATGKANLDEMEEEHAGNQKALSDAKEDLTLTRQQRSEDVKFLQNLKITCGDLDKQWAKRSATRGAEMQAVAETIAILTEDDNREALAKTAASFLQEASSTEMAMRRSNTVAALRRAAQSPDFEADDLLSAWRGRHSSGSAVSGGPRAALSTLAVAVNLDAFTKVKQMMDEMVATLKDEQQEEVKFKAYCQKELDITDKSTYAKTETKKDLEAKIASLETLLTNLAKEIAEANSQISDTKVAIKKASQAREGENAEFQQVVADQRATQAILDKALVRLQDFYVKRKGEALVQAVQTPPVQFNKQKDNAGASPVMGMIEQIIEDSKALEAEAISAETEAQASYETFVKDSNALVGDLTASVTSKSKASAAAKLEKTEAEADKTSTEGELESLAAYDADMHSQCDWVMKNFNIRQKARLEEIEAIQAAKGILSGAQ